MTLIDFPKPKEAWTPPKTLEDWPWEHDLAKPHGVIGDNGIREPERFIPGSCRYCGVPESHLHEDNCPRLKQPAKTLADLAKPHGVIGDNGIREPAFPESEVNPNGTIKPWPRETNDLARYKDASPAAISLAKAINLIDGDRDKSHGERHENFGMIAKLWTVYVGRQIKPKDVAWMMVLLKAARESNGTHSLDNAIDAAGYAALAGELAEGNDNGC